MEVSIRVRSNGFVEHLFGGGEKDSKLNRWVAEWCAGCVNQTPMNICILFNYEIWINLDLVTVVWIRWPDLHGLALRRLCHGDGEKNNNRGFHIII